MMRKPNSRRDRKVRLETSSATGGFPEFVLTSPGSVVRLPRVSVAIDPVTRAIVGWNFEL